MKSIKTIIVISLVGAISACQGQTEKKETTKVITTKEEVSRDTLKQLNLLDEQTKMFNQVFTLAGAGEDNPLGGATNYLELIEKMEMSEEQKQQLREIYDLYDTSLDPKKKEELQLKVNTMLQDAMSKSQQEN